MAGLIAGQDNVTILAVIGADGETNNLNNTVF